MNDFSQGSVKRRIIEQAIPLTLAQIVQMFYNLVDRIYIGHLPDVGELALTGVGIPFPEGKGRKKRQKISWAMPLRF